MKRLIVRMTFNCFLSCLMSKESMEITINTSKWHERSKQWNDNSHISSLKLTGSHFIVILFTHKCQLYIWEQSHPFSSIVVFVYKLLHIPCIFTSNLYSNVTTSTRINSSSVHTYIYVCFIRNYIPVMFSNGLLTNNSTGHNKWNRMDNYLLLFFSQWNSQNRNEVNLFDKFRYSMLLTYFF